MKANEHALRRLRSLGEWGDIDAGVLSLLGCEGYFAEMLDDGAVSTARRHLAFVRAAFRYGVRHELAERDPTADVRLPRLPEASRSPTTTTSSARSLPRSAQRARGARVLPVRLRRPAAGRGGRAELEEVDFSGAAEADRQGRQLRLVPMHPALAKVLRDHKRRARPGRAHVVGTIHDRRLAHRTWIEAVRLSGRKSRCRNRGPLACLPAHGRDGHALARRPNRGDRPGDGLGAANGARTSLRPDRPQALRDAVLTLYRDDPICPQQLAAADEAPKHEARSRDGFLARETERLESLEQQLGLSPS